MADYAIHDTTLLAQANILRKKFGTNDRQDPADYADKMNLMGMLEEKSASGSIVTFSDGADDVPIKSWEVEIAPTLTGKSAIECTQTGKNLLNVPAREEMTRNNVVSSIASDGTITASGQSSGNGDIPITLGTSVSLKSGQVYTFSINGTDTRTGSVYVYFAGGSYISINNANHSGTYTPSADQTITGVTLRTFNGQSITLSAKIMLEVGSSASSYSPYVAPTVSTVNLGRTIHGGTADIVKGEGKDTTLRYELDENDSWSAYSGASHSFLHNVATGEDRPIKQTEASESICNYATYSRASPSSAPDFSFLIQGGQRIVVTADSSIDTVDKFKTWLSSHNLVFVCPASTPTDFTFTPITPTPETALGVNNFWADEGDSEVTYRSSGTIYNYPRGEEASF